MAVPTNTFISTSARGNREELSDEYSRITPEDTPIYTLASKVSFKTTHPEWELDTLAAPAANIQQEGDDYTFAATTPAVRVGTYTQIFRKGGRITGTQDATNNAGRLEQIEEQKSKKALELRKDVEFHIVENRASLGGATRQMGSLTSWITSNVSRNGGANGGFNTGTNLTVAATDGTLRAFTKGLMDSVMQQGYQSGANYKNVITSPYNQSVFVTFISDTNVVRMQTMTSKGSQNTVDASADFYKSPFGTVMVSANRVMAGSAALARNVFFIDPAFLEFGWFRKIKEDPNIAKTGDSQTFMMIGEGALKVKNEAGLGVVADVFGLTAST